MSLLVTGFGPFGDIVENPSSWLAGRLGEEFRILDVSWEAVDDFVSTFDGYDRVLMLGVARSCRKPKVELLGRNHTGSTVDTNGNTREGVILPNGPQVVRSRLWLDAPVSDWYRDGVAMASGCAGGFLCNYIAYKMAATRPEISSGFLHVPKPETMPLEDQLVRVQRIVADLNRRD